MICVVVEKMSVECVVVVDYVWGVIVVEVVEDSLVEWDVVLCKDLEFEGCIGVVCSYI